MTDAERVLVTAAVLIALAFGQFARRLSHVEPRVVGQLRFANLAALLLATTGAAYIGLAIAARSLPAAGLDVTFSLLFVVIAGAALFREPHESLLWLAGGFLAHALFNLAHRPGWLEPELVPRGYLVGAALFDLYFAALCFWTSRR